MVQSLLRSDSFRILFNSPELSEVQRSGFHLFLKKGIAEELSKISCISIKNVHFVVEILVEASNFRLVAPENSYRDCILKMKSYTCKLYVQTKILFKDKVSGELLYQTQPEWVLLADLPMMTKRGHFVINGSPRIVVHQVGRAPGVYFKKVLKIKNDVTNKARFYGDIIPRKGVWVRLQINKKGDIDLKLKKSKKVRAEMVQKCLELLEKEESFLYLQNFVDKSQARQNLLFAKTGIIPNLKIQQNHYQANPFSTTHKHNFHKARLSLYNNPWYMQYMQKPTPVPQKSSFCDAKTKFCTSFANQNEPLHKRSKPKLRFGTCIGRTKSLFSQPFGFLVRAWIHFGLQSLCVQSTVKEQALIRNLCYFKGTKTKSTNKVENKALFFDATQNKAGFVKQSKPKQAGVRFGTRKAFLPLYTTNCANKVVGSFVVEPSSSKFFPAFTKTEKEAFTNVYTSFYKNEIQDIKKRVSGSNKALPVQAKPSQNIAKLFPLGKDSSLSVNKLPIDPKNKSVQKTKLVKTKYSQLSTLLETKQSFVTTRALLGYGNKKRIVKKSNSSNSLKKIREYLYQLFKKSDLYDLGFVGRDKINTKFGISVKETQLTALDIKKTINWLSKLRAGKEEIDDIDHSQNRRVRTSSELIQSQFEIGITRLKNGVLKRVSSPSGAINIKGEQIKANFDGKIYAKQSKVLLLEKDGYRDEKLTKPRLLCKIKHNTTSFYSQKLWHSKEQAFARIKQKSLYHSIFEYRGFLAVPLIKYYLSIVFVQSYFGLQIVKPITGVQLKSNKKQLNFEFTKLYFKGGNSCFVKQDVMSVKLKPSSTKIQTGACTNKPLRSKNFAFATAGFSVTSVTKQYQSLAFVWPLYSSKLYLALFKLCLNRVDALDKPWLHVSKQALQTKSPSTCKNDVMRNKSRTFVANARAGFNGTKLLHNSVFVTNLLAKHKTISLRSQGGTSCIKEQESSTLTQDILYSSNDLVSNFSASEWFSTKPINGALREFFSSSPLSQYMDQTNPLAEITHKRRISSLGVGGVSRESAGMTIRGIHPTHYGRICPIETPEGKNAGLVNSLAFYARVNDQGFIETPYYQVIKGQVQHELGFSFYSARQESKNGFSIAPNDIKQSKSKLLASNISTVESIPVRIADNLLDLFKKKRPSQVDCIGISPVQILSVATSLIPFLEHNDANRALMGSNMQRQAVSLMSSERPLVGTGLEARVLAESGHLVQSKVSGFISNVSAHQVIVEQLLYNSSGNKVLFYESLVTKQSFNKKPNHILRKISTNQSFALGYTNPVSACGSGESVISFGWSIKRQNNDQDKFKQNFTKLDSTISEIIVVLAQAVKAKRGQSFIIKDSLKTTKVIYKSDLTSRPKKRLVQTKLCFNTNNNKVFKNKNLGLSPVIHSITSFSRSNQETCLTQKPLVEEGDWVQRGDVLSDCSAGQKGELSVGKNMFIAYIPWQGYNFEDAIVISDRLVKEQLYTSLHIERYTVIVNDFKDKVVDTNEWFTGKLPGVDSKKRAHLQKSGLPRIGAILREGDILVGKIKYSKKKPATPHEKLVCDILGEHNFSVQNTSLYVPKGVHEARVLTYKIKKRFDKALNTGIVTGARAQTEFVQGGAKKEPAPLFNKVGFGQEEQKLLKTRVGDDRANLRPAGAPKVVHLFLGEKRNIQVGDKMSGRHGNKGIVSTILPKQDMPYLADGSPIDILLNPLGVPSRMNVGQVFECLLGLASTYLHQNFKITAFDELYGVEASQSLVFLKLYQARLQSGQNWLFQVNFPGKTRLTDGRSGECLDQWITVGRAYMLKLIHMVNEKIHARAIGPYALVTQQPLKGRAHKGGQRLGEMEVWAIEGFGAAYILQELLTKKSDDSIGRKEVLKAMLPKSASLLDFIEPFGQSMTTSTQSKEDSLLHNEGLVLSNSNSALVQHQSFTILGQPDIFKVLICELQALCLDVGVYSIKTESFQRQFVGVFE